MGRGTVRRLALTAGAVGAVAALAAATAVAGHDRHVVPGGKPGWTAKAQQTAAVPSTQEAVAKVWLAPRNGAQLKALAQSVSDPSSSEYGHFISPAEYATQFAPTSDQVAAVTSWLKDAGLQVDAVGPAAHYVAVSGSAAAVNAAFGTQLTQYTIDGKTEQAPATELTAPDTVSASILGVTGLSTFGHTVKPADLGAPAAFVNATPCSSYYGEKTASTLPKFNGSTLPYAPCGYTPSQYRGAYGLQNGQGGGGGVTVAITDAFDASPLLSDANTYATRHGDRAFTPRQFSDRSVPDSTVGTRVADCGGNHWYGEQTLDVQAVHGMAPSARVDYYGAASCYDDDLLAALSRVVQDNDASIVTNSWGEPTEVRLSNGSVVPTLDQSTIDAYESVFEQGAAQGIGFYFSSGDDGDEADFYGVAASDFPTSDPWVTSVGGTSLAIGAQNQRLWETGWGTEKYSLSNNAWVQSIPFQYGAGGGFTPQFPDRPWYQVGVVPGSTTGRGVPDVAMDADPTTGMLVGETQSFPASSTFGPAGVHYGEYRIGGTSLASPLTAGFVANVQQSVGGRIGFANPFFYSLAGKPGAYYDVTPTGDAGNVRSDFVNGINADNGLVYSVRTFDQDSSLTTGAGWDDVTGLGTPNFGAFVAGHRH